MKKMGLFFLQIIIVFCVILPFKVNASIADTTCSYEVNIDNKQIDLKYVILPDNNMVFAFNDGADILNDSLSWFHSVDFEDNFLASMVVSKKKSTCPTLFLEIKDDEVVVNPKLKDIGSCDGVCTKLEAKKVVSSTVGKNNLIVDSAVLGTKYKKIDNLYFRYLKDGSTQWSIDGINYVFTTKSISTDIDGSSKELFLSKNLVKKVFKKKNVVSSIDIYVCHGENDKELIAGINSCSNMDVKKASASLTSAFSYFDMFGERKYRYLNCDKKNDSPFGDPKCEESVAWLIDKLLSYVKVIGPIIVIIFTSIDYLRALIQSDDDTMAKLNKKLITRIVLVLFLFFLQTIVDALLELFGLTSTGI